MEEFIANSGRSEDDIDNDVNDYRALKRKIDSPNSHHDNDDIRRMKDLHDVYLLGMNLRNRQKKINAARKVASAAATASSPPLPLPHPTLRIPPSYLHMPFQWIHLHLL